MEKNHVNTYLAVMIDSLKKKEKVLEELLQLTRDQQSLLSKSELDQDQFYEYVDEKDNQLKCLEQIDQGFGQLYQKVKEELNQNRSAHQDEIEELQLLITVISEKSVQIEALEQSNKRKFSLYVTQKRSEIKNFKLSNKTVSNYYKNMNSVTSDDSLFLDKRK